LARARASEHERDRAARGSRRRGRCCCHGRQPTVAAMPADMSNAPPPVRKPSLVIINTGDGKGKSSSAFGVMLRGWARGWKGAVVPGITRGDGNVGEQKAAVELGIEWHAMGDGFTWDSEDMTETARLGREAWERARELLASGDYDLIILDELTYLM